MRKDHNASRAPGGFSLVELMLVVAIVVALTVVTISWLMQARETGRDAARTADVKKVSLALDMYYEQCRQHPATLSTTAANGCPSGTTFADFLPDIPTDPLGSVYAYDTNGAGNNHDAYVVRATLEANNSELATDLDGATHQGVSMDCDDASLYYCLGS